MSNNSKTYSTAAPLILLMTALYISAFFVNITPVTRQVPLFWESLIDTSIIFGDTVVSKILAFIFIILTGLTLFLFNNRFITGISSLLPFIYALLVVANPYCIFFSPIHIAAFLLMWSFFFSVKYRVERQGMDDLFITFLLLGLSSFFYAPIIWCFPLMFGISLRASEDKIKFIFSSLMGLVAPIALYLLILYLFASANESLTAIAQYGRAMIKVEPKVLTFSLAEICRDIFIMILTVSSMIYVANNLTRYKTTKSRAYIRILCYIAMLFPILLIFTGTNHTPNGLIMYLPVSLSIFEYISCSTSRKWSVIRNTLCIALFVVERVIYFLH